MKTKPCPRCGKFLPVDGPDYCPESTFIEVNKTGQKSRFHFPGCASIPTGPKEYRRDREEGTKNLIGELT